MTTETSDPIMTAFVERYAATRANAADVASAARAIKGQISALYGDATRVSGDYHLLKVEFRTSLQSIVGPSGHDREVIDGSDAIVRSVTGYEDMLGDLYVLKNTCDELIDEVEGLAEEKREAARKLMLATGMTEDDLDNLRVRAVAALDRNEDDDDDD